MRRSQIFGNRFFDENDDGGHQEKSEEISDENKSDDKPTPKTYSEDEFKKVVEQRQNLKGKVEEYETELKKIRDAENKSKEDKLKEEKKYQELLDQKEKELESLKPKVEQYESYINSERESYKEKLGDKWLDSFSKLPLTDLRKIAETLIPVKTVDTDNGKGKKGGDPVVLSASEKNRAHEMFEYATHEEAEEAYADILKNRKNKDK